MLTTQRAIRARIQDRPCASPPWISYRCRGHYDWIMIGARDHADALSEARRSTDKKVTLADLQIWDGRQYVDVSKQEQPTC